MNKRSLGSFIEDKVKFHLIGKGYIFLDQNWFSRYGEIDLIFKHKKKIVFVEVKYRSVKVIFPEEILNYKKMRAQSIAINYYLKENKIKNAIWHLDYALVTKVDQKLYLQYFPQVPLEAE